MTLPELSVKRHVLAWMLSGVMVLFGLIAYQRIALDRFPAIEFPVISITTTLKGANPDVVDTSITSILESAVNTMPGLEHVQSASSPGVSVITLTFKLEKKHRSGVHRSTVQGKPGRAPSTPRDRSARIA